MRMFTLVLGDKLKWTYAILNYFGKVLNSSKSLDTCQEMI